MNNFKFDYGWRKELNINFKQKETTIEVILDAYEGEKITSEQEHSFQQYLSHQDKYHQRAIQLVNNYIRENHIEDTGINIKSLYIHRNGEFAFLADCDWDIENGIAIVLSPSEKVTTQDNFL